MSLILALSFVSVLRSKYMCLTGMIDSCQEYIGLKGKIMYKFWEWLRF